MKPPVRPELPTAAVRSSQATLAAVDNSASFLNRLESTYKSGKVVQTTGATSFIFKTISCFNPILKPIDRLIEHLLCRKFDHVER